MKYLALTALLLTATASAEPAGDRIRDHVRFLASDDLEGRGTGTPGGDKAADYIAAQFKRSGLEPAGDDGTYFQSVPLVGITTLPTTTVTLGKHALELYRDYVGGNQTQEENVDVNARIVFCGYGITAPEYDWDDYKGVDLHGKIALIFVNEPESEWESFFKGKALTYYGRWTYKFEEVARHGAVGAILIHRDDLASYPWEVVRNSWSTEKSALQRDGTPRLQLATWINVDVARRMLKDEGKDLDALYKASQSRFFHPLPLQATLQGSVRSRIRTFTSRNVVARKPGSTRPGEAILYSAHYDHLGMDLNGGGDKIYNGAVDNATGCGVLLELARNFGENTPMRRSVYFLASTAEEQGLLGAAYFSQHPPIPVGRISLDLNFDMLPPWGYPEEISANGFERTDFAHDVREQARRSGYKLRPDAHPEAGLYYRMDHFSLAQQGIPAFSIAEGMKFRNQPLAYGMGKFKDFIEHDYHHPSDEVRADWDFDGLAAIVRFSYALGRRAAERPSLIQWLPGDEFEGARKRNL